MLGLSFHPEKCTGCRICEIVCSLSKEHTINPRKARIHVVTVYPGIIDSPVACRQCSEKPCVDACPVRALSVDETTKAIVVNDDACIGCEKCIGACPYAAVTVQLRKGKKKAIICDLCHGDPICVKWCPFIAIEYDP
jgi:Fe-S-cluster-containing hydrogenase component 2